MKYFYKMDKKGMQEILGRLGYDYARIVSEGRGTLRTTMANLKNAFGQLIRSEGMRVQAAFERQRASSGKSDVKNTIHRRNWVSTLSLTNAIAYCCQPESKGIFCYNSIHSMLCKRRSHRPHAMKDHYVWKVYRFWMRGLFGESSGFEIGNGSSIPTTEEEAFAAQIICCWERGQRFGRTRCTRYMWKRAEYDQCLQLIWESKVNGYHKEWLDALNEE